LIFIDLKGNIRKGLLMKIKQTVIVNELTNGVLDPNQEMLGPVRDGGRIIANTAAGCWGPMITPELKGGHEVTKPVYVEGAEVGDAIAIRIESLNVTSDVTASGNDRTVEGRFVGDAFVKAVCPNCGAENPSTHIVGIGKDAIHCDECDAVVTPFEMTNGYTIAFDNNRKIGLTLNKENAEKVAKDARNYMQTPDNSIQNPVLTLAPSDIEGMVARLKPFIGQLGTTPKIPLPDSHNAGDFGSALINAPHDFAQTEESLKGKTDGHMDINKVREGAIVICPVKVKGAGVYIGDVHAMQGEGEIAGHTADVSASVSIRVNVIKNLNIDGPIILPRIEDVPYLAKPLTEDEKRIAHRELDKWGQGEIEESAPVTVVGTGANMNIAIENGLERAADLFDMSVPEVMNRVTITGAIEIGRAPGVVSVTLKVPKKKLEEKNLWNLVNEQYNLN
jgi:formamidase